MKAHMKQYDKPILLFFLITELFLVINDPYAFWWIISLPDLLISAILYLFFLFWIIFSIKGAKRNLPSQISIPIIITSAVWFFYYLFYDDSSYLTRVFLLIITYFFLSYLYKTNTFITFWKYNNRFILIQTILSTVVMILVGIGALTPIMSVLIGDKFVYFWGGCFSKTYIGNLIRPSGFLDEPGALAAWAMYAIVFNYAFVKDKILGRYLPFFTICTLSVAYYIQMGLFLVLKNVKKTHHLVPIALLVWLAITGINMTKGTDFDLYEKTIERFEIDKETGIAGNSRQSAMDNARKIFEHSPLVGIGSSNFGLVNNGDRQDRVADNPYEILAKDGIIGYIISYLPLIMVLFINRRKEVLICLIILFAGYQQRPLHINFMHDMYIWSFLLFAIMDVKQRKSFI